MLIFRVQPPCWLALADIGCLPLIFTGIHPSLLILCLNNGHCHIGAIYQTYFNFMLQNGLRHIGAIPPPSTSMPCFDLVTEIGEQTTSSSVVLSFFPFYSRWYSISLTTQNFLKILHLPPSNNIDLCRPLISLSLCTCIFSSGLVGTRRHFSSWIDSHDIIVHVFIPHYLLCRIIVTYYTTPLEKYASGYVTFRLSVAPINIQ